MESSRSRFYRFTQTPAAAEKSKSSLGYRRQDHIQQCVSQTSHSTTTPLADSPLVFASQGQKKNSDISKSLALEMTTSTDLLPSLLSRNPSYRSESSLRSLLEVRPTMQTSNSSQSLCMQSSSSCSLLSLMESRDWSACLERIASHAWEVASTRDEENRTALHVACNDDAPTEIIEALVQAWPPALMVQCRSDGNMTPLHVTCSSQRASLEVVQILIAWALSSKDEASRPSGCCVNHETQKNKSIGSTNPFAIADVDGDLPLHAACRCGAPLSVIHALLDAYPQAVEQRDHEGLTPVLRLWVRYFVISHNIKKDADNLHILPLIKNRQDELLQPSSEFGGTLEKTELLLKTAFCACWKTGKDRETYSSDGVDKKKSWCNSTFITNESPPSLKDEKNRYLVHAASSVDCPRSIVKLIIRLYPNQLTCRELDGLTPLLHAAQAPIYQVRDFTENGYKEDDEEEQGGNGRDEDSTSRTEDREVYQADGEMEYDQFCEHEITEQQEEALDPSKLSAMSEPRHDIQSKFPPKPAQPPVLQLLLNAGPEMSRVPCPRGLLPLHWALVTGKKWQEGVSHLVAAHVDALACSVLCLTQETRVPGGADSKSNVLLLPFQIAAVADIAVIDSKGLEVRKRSSRDHHHRRRHSRRKSPDLSTIYELLRSNPSLMMGKLSREPTTPRQTHLCSREWS